MLLGRIALAFGDFSEAIRRWSIVARTRSPRWGEMAERWTNNVAFAMDLSAGPLVGVPPASEGRGTERVWMLAAPPPLVWQSQNRNAIAAGVYRQENQVAAKLMLNAGRAKGIAAYRGLRSRVSTDTDGLYLSVAENDIRMNQRQFSAEVQLSGTMAALSYSMGAFFLQRIVRYSPQYLVLESGALQLRLLLHSVNVAPAVGRAPPDPKREPCHLRPGNLPNDRRAEPYPGRPILSRCQTDRRESAPPRQPAARDGHPPRNW